jgi:hypothetical protein
MYVDHAAMPGQAQNAFWPFFWQKKKNFEKLNIDPS